MVIRYLHAPHRPGKVTPRLAGANHPGALRLPGFDAIVPPVDASAVVHARSSSRRAPDPLTAGLFRNAHHPALNRRSLRWFGLPACTANPEDLPPSLAQHGHQDDLYSPPFPFRTHSAVGFVGETPQSQPQTLNEHRRNDHVTTVRHLGHSRALGLR